jgi:hypothetical protein
MDIVVFIKSLENYFLNGKLIYIHDSQINFSLSKLGSMSKSFPIPIDFNVNTNLFSGIQFILMVAPKSIYFQINLKKRTEQYKCQVHSIYTNKIL